MSTRSSIFAGIGSVSDVFYPRWNIAALTNLEAEDVSESDRGLEDNVEAWEMGFEVIVISGMQFY